MQLCFGATTQAAAPVGDRGLVGAPATSPGGGPGIRGKAGAGQGRRKGGAGRSGTRTVSAELCSRVTPTRSRRPASARGGQGQKHSGAVSCWTSRLSFETTFR